jgi:hypothetical protein
VVKQQGTVFGRALLVPVTYRQGYGARAVADTESSSALTETTREALVEFQPVPRYIGVSHVRNIEEIVRGQGNGSLNKDSLARLKELEEVDIEEVMTTYMYGDGQGELGVIHSISGTTVSMKNGYGSSSNSNFQPGAYGTRFIHEGQRVVLYYVGGAAATGVGTASNVDKQNGTFTWNVTSGNTTNIDENDLCLRGTGTAAGQFELNQGYMGVEGPLTADGTLYQLNRANYKMLNGQVRMTSGGAAVALRSLSLSDLNEIDHKMIKGAWGMISDATNGKKTVSVICGNRDVADAIDDAYFDHRQFEGENIDVDWQEWMVGGHKIAYDHMARPHMAYFLRPEDYEMLQEKAWGEEGFFGTAEVNLKYDGTGYTLNTAYIFQKLEIGELLFDQPQLVGVLRGVATEQSVIPGH